MNNFSKIFIILAIIVCFLWVLLYEAKNPSAPPKIVQTKIHQIKAEVSKKKCLQGICDYEFSFNDQTIDIKNLPNDIKDKSLHMYYVLTPKGPCVLKISAYPRTRESVLTQYTENSLFAIKCFNETDFFKINNKDNKL